MLRDVSHDALTMLQTANLRKVGSNVVKFSLEAQEAALDAQEGTILVNLMLYLTERSIMIK